MGGFVEEELTIVGRYNLIFNVLLLVENNVGAAFSNCWSDSSSRKPNKIHPLFATSGNELCSGMEERDDFGADSPNIFEEIQACFASIEISLTSIGRYVDQAVT